MTVIQREEVVADIKRYMIDDRRYSLKSSNKDNDVFMFMKPINTATFEFQYLNCQIEIHDDVVTMKLYTNDLHPGISIRTKRFRFRDPKFSLYEAHLTAYLKLCSIK